MSGSSNLKLKLLYLMKILLEQTDEQNTMSTGKIIVALSAYDIKSERKSVYENIELLRQFGLDIELRKGGKDAGYYISSRQFDLPELKLLVDAVQSSRFITSKKSEELIEKLSSLTSSAQASQLRRQVYIAGRAKSMNEAIFYNIDQIHTAIQDSKQISFKYFDYSPNKKRIYRKNGESYVTTPVTLCWNDDNYYLIAYSQKHDGLTHYRVDRMSEVMILEQDSDVFDNKRFSIAEHVRRLFGMYSGESVRATLAFDNSLVNVVLDHFGKDIMCINNGDGYFEVIADVSLSPVFLGWMFQFGASAEIKAPETLRQAMRELIEANSKKYYI